MTIAKEQVVQLAKQAWDDTGEGWTSSRWFDERAPSFEAFATLARADLEATIAQQAEALRVKDEALKLASGHVQATNAATDGRYRREVLLVASALDIQPNHDILRERDARLVERIAHGNIELDEVNLQWIADQIRKGTWKP